jgi:hypothetical protein
MATISGVLVQLRLRAAGVGSFKTLICTEDTTHEMNSETAERRTNCGILTSVADPTTTVTGNGVSDHAPSGTQVSYEDMATWMKAKQLLDYEYENDADVANAVAEGDAIYRTGSGYITQLSYSASAEADGLGSFSFTLTGTGEPDEFDGAS